VPRFVVEYGLVNDGSRVIKDLISMAVYTFVSVIFIVPSSEKACFLGVEALRYTVAILERYTIYTEFIRLSEKLYLQIKHISTGFWLAADVEDLFDFYAVRSIITLLKEKVFPAPEPESDRNKLACMIMVEKVPP
jgi:hypothetical protein